MMSEVERHYGADLGAGDKPDLAKRAAGVAREAGDAFEKRKREAEGTVDQIRDAAEDGLDRAQEWAHESYEAIARSAVYARRRSVAEMKHAGRNVSAFVEENPIMVGVAGLAAGLLLGSLLPATRSERKYLGPYADDLKREGVRYARDMAEQGREALQTGLAAIRVPGDESRA
jgi:ElaB/YqjD/DUF883 family membrane-anchored ribosome-binding protein